MRSVLFSTIPVLSLVLIPTTSSGQVTSLQLYDGTSGSPTATIYYSNANGTGTNSAYVYADPVVSNGTTIPVYYCVDLWHDNHVGDTYAITQTSSMTFANSAFTDADNRIGWLLGQDQSTKDERAAVQLALWYAVDNKAGSGFSGFTMSTSDSTITSDYNKLISFAGYNPSTSYAANFWAATHVGSNYQDLASASASQAIDVATAPEPATIFPAVAGMLIGIAFIRCRSRVASSKGPAPCDGNSQPAA